MRPEMVAAIAQADITQVYNLLRRIQEAPSIRSYRENNQAQVAAYTISVQAFQSTYAQVMAQIYRTVMCGGRGDAPVEVLFQARYQPQWSSGCWRYL